MQVSLQYAEEHFADIVTAANAGEEIEILQEEQPALRLVRTDTPHPILKDGKRILGAGRGEFRVPGTQEWAEMDRASSAVMNDASVFPSDKP